MAGTVQPEASNSTEILQHESSPQSEEKSGSSPPSSAVAQPQAVESPRAQDTSPPVEQSTADDVSEYHSVLELAQAPFSDLRREEGLTSPAQAHDDPPREITRPAENQQLSVETHQPQQQLTEEGEEDVSYAPQASQQAADTTAHQVDYPALRVRRQVFRRVLSGLGSLGGIQRLGFWVNTVLVISQLAAFIVILGLTHADSCDQPLRVYLSLHTARVGISYPLSIYTRLSPKPRRNATADERAELERNRTLGNARLDRKIRFFASLSTYAAFVIFIFGNWIWYTSDTCRQTSGPLFWGSFAALWVGYLYILQVVAIALLVVFALPLVMLWANIFGIQKKHEIKSLDKKEVDKIPLVLFVPQDPDLPTSPLAGEATTPMSRTSSRGSQRHAQLPSSRKKTKLERLFARARPSSRRSKTAKDAPGEAKHVDHHGYIKGPHPYHPLPENLAACPICLCDFEEPPRKGAQDASQIVWEPLRLLPCGHVLHKDCLDPWLTGSSGRCPVCQAPVKKQPTSAPGEDVPASTNRGARAV